MAGHYDKKRKLLNVILAMQYYYQNWFEHLKFLQSIIKSKKAVTHIRNCSTNRDWSLKCNITKIGLKIIVANKINKQNINYF